MEEQPSINGFLKEFLGWGKPKPKPSEPAPSQAPNPPTPRPHPSSEPTRRGASFGSTGPSAKGAGIEGWDLVAPIAKGNGGTARSPQPRSEAYLNRRKGRKVHDSAWGYLKVICPYLLSKGEVSPGEIARDLGLPKSTLKYNLNNLLDYCQKPQTDRSAEYVVKELLKGHRVVRVGAGKYVRYKLIPVPPDLPPGLPPGSPTEA